MNVIDRIFKRGGTVEATAERSETDIQSRLADIDSAINGGPPNLVELLEERERLTRELQAMRIMKEKRTEQEHRARVNAEAAERRGRLNESLDEISDLVPRMLLALNHFTSIAEEVQQKGMGFEGGMMEDVLGLPPDFGSKVAAAIREAAPNYEWDWSNAGPLRFSEKAEHPKRKTVLVRPPVFPASSFRPPSVSGIQHLDNNGNWVEGPAD